MVETRPAADGTVAWVGGMPAWLRDRTWWQSTKRPTTGVVGRKGLKDDCLVNATGRHSNLPANLGLGLKDGGLAGQRHNLADQRRHPHRLRSLPSFRPATPHLSCPPEVDSLALLDQLERDLLELAHELSQPVMGH